MFSSRLSRAPRSTPFPYTTLFRSLGAHTIGMEDMSGGSRTRTHGRTQESLEDCAAMSARTRAAGRSEEHTSELQSLRHLVCRLLLEKKKTYHHVVMDDISPPVTQA